VGQLLKHAKNIDHISEKPIVQQLLPNYKVILKNKLPYRRKPDEAEGEDRY
jgi:hypothetical protein